MGEKLIPSNPDFAVENSSLSTEIILKIDSFCEIAFNDAVERTNGSPEAVERVRNAIEYRFKPYFTENEIIAQQLITPEYEGFTNKVSSYLGGRVAAIQCDDGRITLDQIGDPRIMQVGRRLQGLPNIRRSTKNRDQMVLADSTIVTSIAIYHDRQRRAGNDDPFTTEFIGPHIFSTNPTHGCGAEMAKIANRGGTPEVDMWDGGINDYFNELGEDGFLAITNQIESMINRGKSDTFDMVHDAYSQGLIFGLKDARKRFDPQRPLRENLISLWKSGDILMTEKLDQLFRLKVYQKATQNGFTNDFNLDDPRYFAKNTMLIGNTALEIAKEEEENGFTWIPDHLKDGKDPRAVRALAYTAIRNSTRRIIGGITSEHHDLTRHPEQTIVVGPISADNNRENIPFIHHVPAGEIKDEDIEDIKKLAGLLKNSLADYHNVNFRDEGRIIMLTGELKNGQLTEESAAEDYQSHHSVVGENAAKVREKFFEGVLKGEIVVIGALHEPKTKRLMHIVT